MEASQCCKSFKEWAGNCSMCVARQCKEIRYISSLAIIFHLEENTISPVKTRPKLPLLPADMGKRLRSVIDVIKEREVSDQCWLRFI